MFIRRSRFYMLKLATNQANAMGKTLSKTDINNVLNNPSYISDYKMSDEE